jgi:hypothetical protein
MIQVPVRKFARRLSDKLASQTLAVPLPSAVSSVQYLRLGPLGSRSSTKYAIHRQWVLTSLPIRFQIFLVQGVTNSRQHTLNECQVEGWPGPGRKTTGAVSGAARLEDVSRDLQDVWVYLSTQALRLAHTDPSAVSDARFDGGTESRKVWYSSNTSLLLIID